MKPDALYVSSSGATGAGVSLGKALLGLDCPARLICPMHWPWHIPTRMAADANTAAERLGLPHRLTAADNDADESFVVRTRELTDGRGADVILDSVGGQNLVDSIGALAYRGTLVSVGVAGRGGSAIEAKDLWAQNNTLRGVFLGGALMT